MKNRTSEGEGEGTAAARNFGNHISDICTPNFFLNSDPTNMCQAVTGDSLCMTSALVELGSSRLECGESELKFIDKYKTVSPRTPFLKWERLCLAQGCNYVP